MIQLENLTKRFHMKDGVHTVFEGLTITLPQGRSLGLLGRNGAGKSTLLQIIAGNMQPTSGRVIRQGNISWPIGAASSFHADMTGLQNTRFLARVYGVDCESLTEFVERFADIGKHFNMPLRTYSSGMKSRLSFGVAMGIPFDTYLIDEVTGAGDQSFKRKSRNVFKSRIRGSSSIMISHSMSDMRNFCDSGLVLSKGVLKFFENIEEAISVHEELMAHSVTK
ncbi:ABC transporter ATP-binding protein [Sulfitobacter sp. R18_2]|uniref:ABC transporter ATP-binding protein n=1 Tax=Sulfitobacter sp. R18_2 TaxID=2821105 RepID=UPI001AD9B349|nr:ABC transporter ATP-binding protein [Sulfitobacter sp. R18_2]MBO9440138.1 ABC transporter ATP-binding protein [Sulfitobacter sp. R18_2]